MPNINNIKINTKAKMSKKQVKHNEINCLQFALRFWNKNPQYKIYYNSDHVINMERCKQDGYLSLESFGFEHIYQSFRTTLKKKDIKLLKKYFLINTQNS